MSKHIGSTLDSLLVERGIKAEVDLLAKKKILADELQAQMTRRKVSRATLAQRMRTSRTVVYRLLDPRDTGVTLATMASATSALGLDFSLRLLPKKQKKAVR